MITLYTNQLVTLYTPTGYNSAAEATYSTSTIRCRIEPTSVLTRNNVGKDLTYTAIAFTLNPLPKDGVLVYAEDKYKVLESLAVPHLNGKVSHYESKLGGMR